MAENAINSGTSINGRELTWPELAEYQRVERDRYSMLASLLNDLDRCEHGRHEGDTCSGCGGPSHGNPRMADDRVLGFAMDGTPIRYPRRGEGNVNERNSWLAPSDLRWCFDCQAFHTQREREQIQQRENVQMAENFNASAESTPKEPA